MNRTLFLAAAGALFLGVFPIAVHGGGIDTGRFYKTYMETDTIADRMELCAELDPAGAAPYLLIFCQALDAVRSGSDSLAVRLMQESLRQQPDFALGCVGMGDAYLELEKWRPALRWYGEAHRIAPDRLDPNYGAGRAWLAMGETEGTAAYEKALASFREMVRIDPSSTDGWSNVGMTLAMLGRYDEAETSYRKALSLSPNEPQIHEALGSVAARRGNEEAAVEEWQKALELDPADAPAAVELASLYGRKGLVDEATRILESGVEAAHVGPDAGRLRRDLGLLYLLQQRDEKACALLQEASVLRPDSRTLAALGHARMLTGKTGEALASFAGAATKDSATVAPFAGAWKTELAPLLAGSPADDAVGIDALKKVLARTRTDNTPKGREATPSLVRLLLPEWRIPEGTLHAAPPVDNENGYDTAPIPVYRALAAYPETAVDIEGTIYVRVDIDAKGEVKDAKVSRGGNPALEWAALDAAKRWRFQPALRNGIPVPSVVEIPFRFSSGSR